jgi:DNA-binding MarR family transcriptional regulator
MIKGENAREKITKEILKISFDGKEHRFSDYNKTFKITNATISKYLKELTNEKLLKKTPGQENEAFRPKYQITPKGKDYYFEKIGVDLHTNCTFLQSILEKSLTPAELGRIRREAAFHPTEKEFDAGCIDAGRIKEMLEHKAKVLGPLHRLFAEVAKDLVKAEGVMGVREDLENIEFHFRNGEVCWTITPNREFYKSPKVEED